MGTNYFLFTRSKRLAHTHFASETEWGVTDEEYEITEEPYLGYKVHLNKCSAGWRPLFQCHSAFDSFSKLEGFFEKYKRYLTILDEYGDRFAWTEYKDIIISHSKREPRPMKWVYSEDEFFPSGGKYVHITDCNPEEAEIWTPLNHLEYAQKEKDAVRRFRVEDSIRHDSGEFYSHSDEEYAIDWSKGDFR